VVEDARACAVQPGPGAGTLSSWLGGAVSCSRAWRGVQIRARLFDARVLDDLGRPGGGGIRRRSEPRIFQDE